MVMMRHHIILTTLPLLTLAALPPRKLAPILPVTYEPIPNQYIVKLKRSSSIRSRDNVISLLQDESIQEWSLAMNGFAAIMSGEILDTIRTHTDIEYIEPDGHACATYLMNPDGSGPFLSNSTSHTVTQSGATWGISRVSSKRPGAKDYKYQSSAGGGTCVYIIDTGMDLKHAEFEGRAVLGKKIAPGRDGDRLGHGTHTGGTVGGKLYGIAKKAKLIDVKAIPDDGVGPWSHIISAFDYVISDNRECPKGKIINASLGAAGGVKAPMMP
ncbi:hypothetical protein VHEMI07203 [[Torrubiella] hemipterigena]|uniref:Peptidase S8/S53 domain-containing protein n=1 Tax=[Torrubiella] hemipterigena TaxID=1531966 RepID=A0A0A1T2S0_9HYPO|nr:hypothetical protein VHEMI07203 [[Torrubiella] hemipterigena]